MAVLLEQKGNRNSKSPRDTSHAVTSWYRGVGELTHCEPRRVAQCSGHLGAVAAVSARHSLRQNKTFPLAPYSERALPTRPGMCDSLLDFEVWLLLNLRGTGMKLSPCPFA